MEKDLLSDRENMVVIEIPDIRRIDKEWKIINSGTILLDRGTGSPPSDRLSTQNKGGRGTTPHPQDREICHKRDFGQSDPHNEEIGLLEKVTEIIIEIEIVTEIEKETDEGDSG